jgi:hypothetical protein
MKKVFAGLLLSWIILSAIDIAGQNFKNPRIVVEPTLFWCNQKGYVKVNALGKKVCDCDKLESESMMFRVVENELISKFKSAGWDTKAYCDVFREEEKNEASRLAKGSQQSDYEITNRGPLVDFSIQFQFPTSPSADGARIGFEFITLTYSILETATSEKIATGNIRSISTPQGYYDLEQMVLNCIETEFPNVEAQLRAARDERESTGRETRIEFTIEGDFDMYEPCGNSYLSDIISTYMNSIAFNGDANPEESDDFRLTFRPIVPPDVDQIKPWLLGKGESSLIALLQTCNLMPKPSNKGAAINVSISRK